MKTKGLVAKIYRFEGILRVSKKMKLLGLSNPYELNPYLKKRLLGAFIVIISTIFLNYGHIISPICGLIFWYGYEYWTLDKKIKARRKRLDYEGIFFFEILALPLESGLSLEKALITTTEIINNELANEIKKSLEELKVGKNLNDVLNSLKEKIPSPTINNILLNIMQANINGNNLSEIINNQITFLRKSQILDVKEEISKLPIKISVISTIMFIPIILIILLAPVILDSIEENKKLIETNSKLNK